MADFSQAVQLVIQREGGLVNDPDDPGGLTKYGISKRQYPTLDIAALTTSQAAEIYHRDYWRFDTVPDQVVGNKLLDMAVNLGLGTTVGLVQDIVGVPVDLVWGPKTEAASVNYPDFIGHLRVAHVQHYLNLMAARPSLEKFRNGWLLRAVQ